MEKIWNSHKDDDELKLDIKNLLYPPCFCLHAYSPGQSESGSFSVCFEPSEGDSVFLEVFVSSADVTATNGE